MNRLSFGQELRHLLRAFSPAELAVEPATTSTDAENAVRAHSPSLVLFSGHTWQNRLLLETESGRADVGGQGGDETFIDRLIVASASGGNGGDQPGVHHDQEAGKNCRGAGIQALVLNGCMTSHLGERLCKMHPHLCVVCWSTVAEDSALRAFGRGFFDSVAAQLRERRRDGHHSSTGSSAQGGAWEKLKRAAQRPFGRLWVMLGWELGPFAAEQISGATAHGESAPDSPLRELVDPSLVEAAFVEGCRSYVEAGYSFGDPQSWLHPAGHPHLQRPNLRDCCGCIPPVHGQAILLRPPLEPMDHLPLEHSDERRGHAGAAADLKRGGGDASRAVLTIWAEDVVASWSSRSAAEILSDAFAEVRRSTAGIAGLARSAGARLLQSSTRAAAASWRGAMSSTSSRSSPMGAAGGVRV